MITEKITREKMVRRLTEWIENLDNNELAILYERFGPFEVTEKEDDTFTVQYPSADEPR